MLPMNMQIRYSKQAKDFINEMIKRVVLAWDSDFTKLTPEEKQRLEQAEKELKNGEIYSHDEVWGHIE